MLSDIKFDFQADSAEDFEYFRTLFIRNAGIQQMMYDFYLGDILVRLQVCSHNEHSLICVGLFNYEKVEKSVSLTQFNPLSDMRFSHFVMIRQMWDAESAWAYLSYSPDNVEASFFMINEVLKCVARTNNLKAFL